MPDPWSPGSRSPNGWRAFWLYGRNSSLDRAEVAYRMRAKFRRQGRPLPAQPHNYSVALVSVARRLLAQFRGETTLTRPSKMRYVLYYSSIGFVINPCLRLSWYRKCIFNCYSHLPITFTYKVVFRWKKCTWSFEFLQREYHGPDMSKLPNGLRIKRASQVP